MRNRSNFLLSWILRSQVFSFKSQPYEFAGQFSVVWESFSHDVLNAEMPFNYQNDNLLNTAKQQWPNATPAMITFSEEECMKPHEDVMFLQYQVVAKMNETKFSIRNA